MKDQLTIDTVVRNGHILRAEYKFKHPHFERPIRNTYEKNDTMIVVPFGDQEQQARKVAYFGVTFMPTDDTKQMIGEVVLPSVMGLAGQLLFEPLPLLGYFVSSKYKDRLFTAWGDQEHYDDMAFSSGEFSVVGVGLKKGDYLLDYKNCRLPST
jgi:hypothetical protein|tara:strand:+ start:684 stop:1145 length:462 start_codon:yes stop_codon:yes gene_type:complete